jgi:hypothetical protein
MFPGEMGKKKTHRAKTSTEMMMQQLTKRKTEQKLVA